MVYQIIEHTNIKTLDVFDDKQNGPLMGVNVIFFKNLLDPVKSFIFNNVRLNLLLLHDFG